MKKLIVALFVVGLMAACKSSTGPGDTETQYPFTEQTWQVESGENATWIGSSGMQKAVSSWQLAADSTDSTGVDTTLIDSPEKYGLEIHQIEGDSTAFAIQFIDSTYNNKNSFPYTYPDTLWGNYIRTVHATPSDDFVEVDFIYPFECQTAKNPVDTLNIVLAPYQAPQDTIEFYQVAISGALETVNHIICES